MSWSTADEIARHKRTGTFLISPEEVMGKRLDQLLLSEDDLRNLPPVQWLVDGLLQEGELNLLVGQRASGKSLFALDLALALASGAPRWLGLATKPCGVLYVTLENLPGVRDRTLAWRDEHPDADLSKFRVMRPDGEDVLTRNQLDTYMAADNYCEPGLIIIDTLARFDPEAEGGASDTGKTIAALDRLRQNRGSTVLLVHHLGKDANRGARGSSALEAAPTQILTAKKEDRTTISLSITKSNNAPEADAPVLVRLRSGRTGGVVIDPGNLNTAGFTRVAAMSHVERLRVIRVRALLATVLGLTRDTPANTTEIRNEHRGSAKDLSSWLWHLVDAGYLTREEDGRSKLYSPGERPAEELTDESIYNLFPNFDTEGRT